MLEHPVDPEHQKCAQWVMCLMITLAMQEVGHFQLQHELMIVDKRHRNHQPVPDIIECVSGQCPNEDELPRDGLSFFCRNPLAM